MQTRLSGRYSREAIGQGWLVRFVGKWLLVCPDNSKLTLHQHFHPRNHLHACRPWQTVAIDLCGPVPTTQRGNTQILVIADHFTRWYDALPIPNGLAEVVAKVLDERTFCYFGVPEEIHSDQGRQFESELLQQCNIWGCKKTRTTPYHPQGISVVERLN